MDYSLFQKHTINIYNLKDKSYTIKKVKARSLLSASRFDLFAKLFYISYRETNKELALKVYSEHIKAFNPDLKEPGRADKNSIKDFVDSFENLIDSFKAGSFDDTISIIPVSSNGIILDGGHRIAALAYYDRDVTIAVFNEVYPKTDFDYFYFRNRGLSTTSCDYIAGEMIKWLDDVLVAFFWPKMGNERNRDKAYSMLSDYSTPFYRKTVRVSLLSMTKLMVLLYGQQEWVGTEDNNYAGARDKALNCYDNNKTIDFIFFRGIGGLDKVLELKESIRSLYPYGKHSVHITDNKKETEEISYYLLDGKGQEEWLKIGGYENRILCWLQRVQERFIVFRKVHWINFKVTVYSLLTLKFLSRS